jgi:PKD repeat protein
VVAQDIIAEANRQFGRDDIGVILVPNYNDSKRQVLSDQFDIMTNPLNASYTVYPNASLDSYSADLCLYLGGYDVFNGWDFAQGASDGYNNTPHGRHSWAQMVPDNLPIPLGYLGTSKGRRVISIHEIGHQFDADHQDNTNPPFYNRAFTWGGSPPLNYQTVMWSEYSETAGTYEFSSLSHMGDTTRDNARRIRDTKGEVSGYAVCMATLPSADFEWDPDIPDLSIGQKIQFTAKSVANNPTLWYWEFGDGTTSNVETPELHAYSEVGSYTIRLTVANCKGGNSVEHTITVTNPSSSPNPDGNGNPKKGSVPLKVQFTDSSTPPPQEWNWSFGDGNVSPDQNTNNTYYKNGNYTVNLTVKINGLYYTKIFPDYITVAPQAPNASFISFVKNGTAPLFIQFNDTSSNYPTSWDWNFGDGSMFNTTDPSQKNQSHTFRTVKLYNVTLNASNSLGTSTAFQLVKATNIAPPTNTSSFEYTIPGSYTYTSPAGIASINITLVGAGGGGGGGNYNSTYGTGNGGYGGNASQVVNTTQIISPGSLISIKVGAKGTGGQGGCGQNNGNPGNNGANTSVSIFTASGGLGGMGGIPLVTNHWDGYPGQNGSGSGQYATSGQSAEGNDGIGGSGGIGKGAGGGGSYGSCTGVGGNGADGYVIIQPIIPPPLIASFTATPRAGPVNLTVEFTDTSTGDPTLWEWDFGDGNFTDAMEQHPLHLYNTIGTYAVKLNATNTITGSNTTIIEEYINVGLTDDAGIFRPGTHKFLLKNGTATTTVNWGLSSDTPINGDWDGDGHSEVGVFRPSNHTFYLKNGSVTTTVIWGLSNDTPVCGDWNGDGLGDVGVFRNWTAQTKFILKNGSVTTTVIWGLSNDTPVCGDWNGDGLGDVGVFRPSTHTFILKNGTARTTINYGYSNETPVSGDWNGDGLWDVGTFRTWSANAKFMPQNGSETTSVVWGQKTDEPVTGKW